jgi:hypothetical protein
VKRGTIEHPKTIALASLLRVRILEAVGILESLWHWTAKYAQRGDIGRFSPEVIAAGIHWHGPAEKLMEALINANGGGKYGWVERHDEYGYVIHDWHEHADESTKKWLDKRGESFWNGSFPFGKKSRMYREPVANDSRMSREQVASGDRLPEPEPLPEPIPEPEPLPKPEPEGAAPPHTDEADAVEIPPRLDTPEFRQAWSEWHEDRRERRKRMTPRAERMQLDKLEPFGPDVAIKAIRESIANGWTGVFPEKYATANSTAWGSRASQRDDADSDQAATIRRLSQQASGERRNP